MSMLRTPLTAGLLLFCSAPACSDGTARAAPKRKSEPAMRLESTAFAPMGRIPIKHTCDGADVSPPLQWVEVPEEAASLALIVTDPDAPDPAAPKTVFTHWVLFNLPPLSSGLAEGARNLPPGTSEGQNDWKRTGYGGPCPPTGRHRYFHDLYALDTTLELTKPTRSELEDAMEGHVLAKAQLIGTYEKQKRDEPRAARR
jgi:Raf kinase inhibitor-like YbhB/YbcL family protein